MQGENYSICIDTRYCCWLCTDRLDLLPPENAITILYCFSAALLMVVYDESSSSFLHMYWMINDASWMKPPGLLHLYGTSVLYSSNFFRTHAYTIKIYIFHPFSYCAGHEIKKLEREKETFPQPTPIYRPVTISHLYFRFVTFLKSWWDSFLVGLRLPNITGLAFIIQPFPSYLSSNILIIVKSSYFYLRLKLCRYNASVPLH